MASGLIYAAFAVVWLAVLIPMYLRRQRVDEHEDALIEHFAASTTVLASGSAPLLDHNLSQIDGIEVSTPMTRRAAIRDLRRREEVAAGRRRTVLVVLMMVFTVVLALAVGQVVPWWTLAIPGGLVVAFLAVARVTVRQMVAGHDRRVEQIRQGTDSHEETVLLSVGSVQQAPTGAEAEQVRIRKDGGLWEPIPITAPTYVSKPLAPRTVRTIDLSAPAVSAARRTPVTADTQSVEPVARPAIEPAEADDLPRAVND